MKKIISLFLAVILLFTCVLVGTTTVCAAKTESSRGIAIVFDNSGSMYDAGDQAWCRATYAMEVFASMLNSGDTLQIYPMHPITVGDKEFTMQNPLQITDAAQASTIREILTKDAGGTPIESIDCAVQGLQKLQTDKKYLVVLTDGGTFSKNGNGLTKKRTKTELDKRIQAYASKTMTVMYLGIGSEACVPNTKESEYFIKKQAVNTTDVLSTLTDMCNLIFGRDTLPKNRISNKTMEFDISMKKLIVFVQGDNISDLKIKPKSGGSVGKLINSQQAKYSTKGAADYKSVADTSLQGMITTYEDCAAGSYNIEYVGTATSVEVYYEPDADLEFVFTDSEGNNVDLNSLYEGEYKVSFGMKDAKTGKLISSDLLGKPHYEGSYTINGEKTNFTHDGQSGEVPIVLKMNDTFEADLTVTYLSGYTISKNSTDFGWPKGGVKVLAPPLGKFDAKLTVSQKYILIKELEQTPEFIVDLTIGGKKLTAEEFDAVTVTVDCGGIAHTVTPKKEDSQYLIKLEPTNGIAEGSYRINVDAKYLDEAGRETQDTATAKVTLSNTPLWVKWTIGLFLLMLLILLLWIILHIKVLPKYMHTTKRISSMNFDGDDVTQSTNFFAETKKNSIRVQSKYGGKKFGISMDAKPGSESYLYKPQKRRSALVNASSVRKFGQASITEVMIGSTKFDVDDNGKLKPALANQKPFLITNDTRVKYSGTIKDAGIDKDFEVVSKLNFKKK